MAVGQTSEARPRDVSADRFAYCENVRDCKPSTMRDCRNMVRVPIATSVNRTLHKHVVVLGGIFKRSMKLYRLPRNPVDIVERPRVRRPAKIDVPRPEEVLALVRAAEEGRHRPPPGQHLGPRGLTALHRQDKMDPAIIHVAAFVGLRMGEILALRWRDIDFSRRTIHVRENWTQGETTTPNSGSERAVPMAEEVAQRLARLGQREHFTGDEGLVFCTTGGLHLGYRSLKVRYLGALKAAGLREDSRSHNLRHTFGSTVIRHADSRKVMEWMGHADLTTTRRYLAFVDREDAAKRVSEAFRLEEPSAPVPQP